MRGLRQRIETVIEDVHQEIRVDLGLEQVTPEELERLKQPIDFTDELPEVEQIEDEEESEEAKAFGKKLDEIEAQYKSIKFEDTDESKEDDISEKSSFEVMEEILSYM